jgi:hypothetical protein
MINMSSMPSPSKNNFLISGSASAEQRDVKQFSINSASSSSAGSFLLYDYEPEMVTKQCYGLPVHLLPYLPIKCVAKHQYHRVHQA